MNTKFSEILVTSPLMMTEGAVVERLKREFNIPLDPFIVHAGLIYENEGRKVLKHIYTQYIEVTRKHGLPIMITTPTRRANQERITQSKFNDVDVNRDCFTFLSGIRDSYKNMLRRYISVG